MRIAILSGGTGWHVQDLLRAAGEGGHTAHVVDFRGLAAGGGTAYRAMSAAAEYLALLRAYPLSWLLAGDQMTALRILFGALFVVTFCTAAGELLLHALGIRLERLGRLFFHFVAGAVLVSI